MASDSDSSSSFVQSRQNKFNLEVIDGKAHVLKKVTGYVGELDGATETKENLSSAPLMHPKLTDYSQSLMSMSFPYVFVEFKGTIYVWRICREGFSFGPIDPKNVVFLGKIGKKLKKHLKRSGVPRASFVEMKKSKGGVRLYVNHQKPGPLGGIMKKSFHVMVCAKISWNAKEERYDTSFDADDVLLGDVEEQ
jgi:hypothetical protein